MATQTSHNVEQPAPDAVPIRDAERGYTVLEMIVAVWFVGILTVVALGTLNGRIEKARLARCMTDLRSFQSTVWIHSDGMTFPPYNQFWDIAWAGKRPGPYYYFPTDFDKNAGHGNDTVAICDDDNPGASEKNRDCRDIDFVLLCHHDHGVLANYVYIEDEGPPLLAGWAETTNPGYDSWLYNPPRYDH
jgi:Tfp pilus assembly protein PilE